MVLSLSGADVLFSRLPGFGGERKGVDWQDLPAAENTKKSGGRIAKKLLDRRSIDIQTFLKSCQLKPSSLERVTIDTTVQPKAIACPTDSRLYLKALQTLIRQAKKAGVMLRQSHTRLAKKASMKASHYVHAKQFKRTRRELKRRPPDFERRRHKSGVLEYLPRTSATYNFKGLDVFQGGLINVPKCLCVGSDTGCTSGNQHSAIATD